MYQTRKPALSTNIPRQPTTTSTTTDWIKNGSQVAQFVMTSRLLSTYNKATDSLGQLRLPRLEHDHDRIVSKSFPHPSSPASSSLSVFRTALKGISSSRCLLFWLCLRFKFFFLSGYAKSSVDGGQTRSRSRPFCTVVSCNCHESLGNHHHTYIL